MVETQHSKSKDFTHGQPLKKTLGRLDIEISNCRTFLVNYNHPKYDRHLVILLDGTNLPNREVAD